MELEQLASLQGNFEELQKKIKEEKPVRDTEDFLKQYDPAQHDVTDTTARPDKIVQTDENTTTTQSVARLPVPIQKRIVTRAAQFLCGNPIELRANPSDGQQEDLLEVLKKVWRDNKLDYESKGIAKRMMAETEVAELWYTEEAAEGYWSGTPFENAQFRPRVKILSPALGDSLYPVFNTAGDMIAFGRGYTVLIGGNKQEHFDLYTATSIILGKKTSGGWEVAQEVNLMGEIPVIYYEQPAPEWADVQSLIDRYEKLISNHADTNDYFGSPMVVVKGKVEGFAKKGDQGKVLEISDGASAAYLTWDQSPESVRLEMQNLRSLIFDMTDTPDLSFDQVKGLGNYSGIALKMLFIGAHMKAAEKEETFGKCVQRRINYLINALGKINVSYEKAAATFDVKPQFEFYLPKNELERVEMLMTANGNKPIVSQKTAVELNPLVEDPEAELENLKEESDALTDALNTAA